MSTMQQYYEPETGHMFRSLKAVERYLAGFKQNTSPPKLLGINKKDKLLRKSKMVIREGSTGNRSSSSKLPRGWVVEKCVRTKGCSAGMVDKYYIEPGTMQKFRSLVSVQRHLAEVDGCPQSSSKSKPDKQIVMLGVDKKDKNPFKRKMAIVGKSTKTRASSFKLPEGWVVEECVRISGRFGGMVDKYYYEPGTWRKFRSLISVRRHLAEMEKTISNIKEETSSLNSANPPVKVKWVCTGPEGDSWNPFVGESTVPDFIKQQWAERFILQVDYI